MEKVTREVLLFLFPRKYFFWEIFFLIISSFFIYQQLIFLYQQAFVEKMTESTGTVYNFCEDFDSFFIFQHVAINVDYFINNLFFLCNTVDNYFNSL